MRVAKLIEALGRCDPEAVVLIPTDRAEGEGSEPVADVTAVDTASLAGGTPAPRAVVRLTGLAMMLRSDVGA